MDEQYTSQAGSKQLVKDGVWQVPASERPAGWENMPVSEPGAVAVSTSREVEKSVPSVAVASSSGQLPCLQPVLLIWAERKLDEARAEHADLKASTDEARRHKWKTSALQRAATKAMARVVFYEKVVAALEAGYMLFPPVEHADVIAIRTRRDGDGGYQDLLDWQRPVQREQPAEGLALGEGVYKSPWMGWTLLRAYKDEKGNGHREWALNTELKDAEFPLVMAKPEIVAATNAAMEAAFFDEIRLFPFQKRRGDPCILGSIFNPVEGKRLYFLISWRIDQKDL